MKVQIRTSELSALQIAKEELYEEAVYLLRQNGFDAEYNMTVVSSPTDEAGYIHIKGSLS